MPPNTKVEVRRSSRRRRTVSAYRDGDKTVVLVPATFSRAEEQRWVDRMLERLEAREERRRPDDDALHARARDLADRYLDGRARPDSVRWVDNQRARWGSCTPENRSIRLSKRLAGMPAWVVDYVLVHELVHLLIPHHGAEFWELVHRYPKAERARGYLEGVSAAARTEAGGAEGGEMDDDVEDLHPDDSADLGPGGADARPVDGVGMGGT
ncbi:M48 family metallopeptidase [Streptomonospora nanhaiensis]|uniref:YgjP-like metallopeptidase domain-containing protein n=1 Tax=Streptomonospora nanhaiensis TaxID=1323731 RepID=A0A853BS16_9ACTN|nr:M48 family metallopeptidase [Streptomonospora nanhaiensis]MBV2362718.1 M48 family metallopeptidase [Streptomonospora nanhaiensis]MBX9390985.1 M48 family metallopeptidase [Streptomonospora nanhaiensis]NYI97933.1 hypothetical protein [Streptomonospora nanhaiensis]